MTLEEAYQALGLKPGAKPEQIKAAYRRKALELHPDRRSDHEKAFYEKKFRALKDAYELIKKTGPIVIPEEREPVETEGWGPEIKVPTSRWRDNPNRQAEDLPLGEKLGIQPTWALESWALWGVVIPGGAILLVFVVRLIGSWINPPLP